MRRVKIRVEVNLSERPPIMNSKNFFCILYSHVQLFQGSLKWIVVGNVLYWIIGSLGLDSYSAADFATSFPISSSSGSLKHHPLQHWPLDFFVDLVALHAGQSQSEVPDEFRLALEFKTMNYFGDGIYVAAVIHWGGTVSSAWTGWPDWLQGPNIVVKAKAIGKKSLSVDH